VYGADEGQVLICSVTCGVFITGEVLSACMTVLLKTAAFNASSVDAFECVQMNVENRPNFHVRTKKNERKSKTELCIKYGENEIQIAFTV